MIVAALSLKMTTLFLPSSRPPGTCALMECCLCFEVTHPTCATDYGVEGFIKMDLPNSWECPKCIKARQAKSSEADEGPSPPKVMKTEPTTSSNSAEVVPEKIPIASGADTNFKGYQVQYLRFSLFIF
jgi:hypothetical protein